MKHTKKSLLKEIKNSVPGYICILPTIAVLIIFLYIPFFNAFRISLYNYKGYGAMTDFVGIANYVKSWSDPRFWMSFGHTFKLIACDIVFSLLIAFFFAYQLFRGIRGKNFFNTILFIPYLISMVVVGCIWKTIYNPDIGPLNQILQAVGLGGLAHSWLSDTNTVMNSIIVTWIWRTIPFNLLILYANLMTLPNDYLEAADIDGASTWQKIRYVILPYMVPTFVTLIILSITNDLRCFDLVHVMSAGGPGGASEVLTTYIYQKAFAQNRFGQASAASIIMMVVMIGITILTNIISRRAKGDEHA